MDQFDPFMQGLFGGSNPRQANIMAALLRGEPLPPLPPVDPDPFRMAKNQLAELDAAQPGTPIPGQQPPPQPQRPQQQPMPPPTPQMASQQPPRGLPGPVQQQPQPDPFVQQQQALMAERAAATQQYQQATRPVDTGAVEAYGRQRAESAPRYLLHALAAERAGKKGLGGHYYQQARQASEPVRMTGGHLTPEGGYLADPGWQRSQDEKSALARINQIDKVLEQHLTRDSREQLQKDRLRQEAILARERMANTRGNTIIMAGAQGGPGGFGGTATQVGVDDANSPVLRLKDGRLVHYGANGQPQAYQGAIAPKPTGTGQPTEDERKAAGWVSQAEFAAQNAQAALKSTPGASAPGGLEQLVGYVPKLGETFANMARSGDRQRFVQAAGSFSEAALRAATGAGQNEAEARQKIAEITPQWGDKDEVVKQKMAAWPMYLQSLRARAGRALPQAAPGGAPADNDPLGIRGR